MFSTGPVGYLLLITSAIGMLLAILMMCKSRPASYYVFSTNLIIYSYTTFTLAAIKIKWLLLTLPHLFLTTQPCLYLIGPLCYYFVRLSINPEHRFHKWEALHLLPFLLHTAELIPFYLTDTATKREIIQQSYGTGEYLILPTFTHSFTYFQHIFLKSISILIYSSAALSLILKNYKHSMRSFRELNRKLYTWITLETMLRLLWSITGIVKAGLSKENLLIDQIFTGFMILDSLVGFGFILLNPKILHGLKTIQYKEMQALTSTEKDSPEQSPAQHDTPDMDQPQTEKSNKEQTDFIVVERYFQTRKPFLEENMSREIHASEIGLSPRRISTVIKSVTGMNFADYVNSYRIRYLEETAPFSPDWHKFTIDALGNTLGFANRISFYNAAKRHRNMTPTELLRSLGIGGITDN